MIFWTIEAHTLVDILYNLQKSSIINGDPTFTKSCAFAHLTFPFFTFYFAIFLLFASKEFICLEFMGEINFPMIITVIHTSLFLFCIRYLPLPTYIPF